MKKLLMMFALVGMMACFAGCGKTEKVEMPELAGKTVKEVVDMGYDVNGYMKMNKDYTVSLTAEGKNSLSGKLDKASNKRLARLDDADTDDIEFYADMLTFEVVYEKVPVEE